MLIPVPLFIRVFSLLALLAILSLAAQSTAQQPYEIQGDLPPHIQPEISPPRSPEEALKSFQLVDGFQIELVAAEPLMEDPVVIDFDSRGRLWVVEMRGFMMDINATGQFEKVGRITVLEDTNGDGRMDKSTRFLDGLVLPRAIRCFQEGVLVAEHDKLWFFEDADGDLIPENKILIDPEYATSGSVEHRPNGLLIGLDNWIYNSRSSKRYRRVNGNWIIEATENRGQWGISQDDFGRLYYNFHWSQLHCDLAPPNTLNRNSNFNPTLSVNATVSTDQLVYPIRMNTAVNRGYRPGVLDEEGKLKRFASACAPWIYRGGSFPAEFNGNAFVCAPAANTIKRNLISDLGLSVTGTNAYSDRDFLASTDERFRPVALSGGPDGALYVVDMYRGIIQQADFMTTYLRKDSETRKLEQPIHLGRIYRIRPMNGKREPAPDFQNLSAEALVNQLTHPNGWVRDQAQQWLVWKRPAAAVKSLVNLALGQDPRAAVHALWSLDAMNAEIFALSLNLIASRNANLATTAMAMAARQASNYLRIQQLVTVLSNQYSGSELRAFHAAIALGELTGDSASELLFALAGQHAESPHVREAVISSLTGGEMAFLEKTLHHSAWQQSSIGKQLLVQGIAGCAARSENQSFIVRLLELSRGKDWRNQSIAEGVFTALFERTHPFELDRDPQVKDPRFKTLLKWPGHEPRSESIAQGRPLNQKERALYAQGQTLYASLCSSCHGPDGRGMNLLAPPLVRSEWVTGDPDRLAKILLHGLEDAIEVNGKMYSPPDILPGMPPAGMMSNEEMAAVMTYVRRAWNHSADPVTPGDIQRNRDLTATQEGAYTVEELSGSAQN